MGAPVEFVPREILQPVTTMLDGGRFRTNCGQWTDDTSMALCLATSLIESRGFSAKDQMERYYKWLTTGYLSSKETAFGIGQTVFRALTKYCNALEPYCGSTSHDSAGNGSLMRLAPVPLFYYPDEELMLHYSAESSRTTHGAVECLEANRIFGKMLHSTLCSYTKNDILHSYKRNDISSESLHEICEGNYFEKQEEDIYSTGYVVHTLEAALWCFRKTNSFREALLKAVNLGGDTDTIGAVCGQIAGAFYGVESIPDEWKVHLYKKEFIIDLARQLFYSKENRHL